MPLLKAAMNRIITNRNHQAYIAIALISLLPNLILIPIPYSWLKTEVSNGWNVRSIFMCFASAGLLGDVLLHTLPYLLSTQHQNHGHNEHHHHQQHHDSTCTDHDHSSEHSHETSFYSFFGMDRSLFITLVIIVGFLVFFLSEKVTISLLCGEDGNEMHHHHHHHGNVEKNKAGDIGEKESSSTDKKAIVKQLQRSTSELNMSISAYLNLIADSLHNFTDGLAIGASFSGGQGLGLATFLSIICHELPHEIGDFTILIQSGFTKYEAIRAQFITAVAAVLGTVVGLQAQRHQVIEDLLLAFTSGGFLFLATVTMLPAVVRKTSPISQIIAEAASFILGITMMVIVAMYE